MNNADTLDLATDLTMAWLVNPSTRASADDVPAFLTAMHKAVSELADPTARPAEGADTTVHEPAVSVRKSLASPDHIISLIDGKAYKTLKRHLSRHGLTPAAYRERYGLRPDYPMTAPSYSAARKAVAKAIGLGMKPGRRPSAKNSVAAPQRGATGAKAKSGRMTAAQAKKAAQAHLGSMDEAR